ncbi:glycosyltransferase family 25 protein [Aeromonas caviae]|uniref:glycosyltransferase family 25 protein n=1 Tax=Aeromonas caviae TaxID=648 RepID=UPI002B47EAC5|nr:glycosyltransferase family 25 protein [Aeromonas caviae]
MIPVFVISLTRSHDRRAFIEKHMHSRSIDFSFFDAVDGKGLSEKDLERVDFPAAKQFCGHDLSLGEVGCAMSHIRIYEMMIAENIERCIILEDDIYLHSHFQAIVNKAIATCQSDIIFLYHGKAKSWPWMKKMPEGYRLAKYISPSRQSKRGIISAVGYILTLSGARKLLSKAYPIRMPSDYLTGRLQLNGLTASGIEPCCMDCGMFDTTIDDRNYGPHTDSKEV